ncbi:hypothetical protein FA13DRAFT_650429 [Coprinellus micaceus]|uniref:Nephrocystin 3-like N-terminal domain-containing protein n=1 Tax=Coprinellus micaceus TaxID=71717 RepID=A0A4Y7T7H9_COPMI|nr:hypothetical protein FA13DRAFT_650429 [Coprinellus micaceus]
MSNVLYPGHSQLKLNGRYSFDHSAKRHHVGNVACKNRQARALQDLPNNVAVAAVHDSERRDPPRCHPETRLTVQGQILDWAQCDEETTPQRRILWLSGPAGGGKTVIMDTVACKLKKRGTLAASFFFSSYSSFKACRIKDHFVTTLVYQLIRHESVGRIKCLKRKVLSLIQEEPSILEKSLKEQMEVLVLRPIRDCQVHLKCQPHHNCRLHSRCHSDSDCECHFDCRSHSACRAQSNSSQAPQVILVAGLDECGAISHHSVNDPNSFAAQSSRQQDHLEILSVLLCSVKDAACPFRITIANRQEPGINRFFSSHERSSVHISLDDRYNPDADIALFLTAKFSQIRLRSPARATILQTFPLIRGPVSLQDSL